MANKNPKKENLKPIRTEKEARIKGQNGGIKSGQKRRELKTIKEYLKIGLDIDIQDKNGNTFSRKEAGVLKLIERYIKGDPKAFDTVVELLGENPAKKLEVTNTTPQIVVANQSDADILQRIANTDYADVN